MATLTGQFLQCVDLTPREGRNSKINSSREKSLFLASFLFSPASPILGCFCRLWPWSGAHNPEPPIQLCHWVNPVPYLFIFRIVISAGVLWFNFPQKWSCFRRRLHNSPKEKWRPKGKTDLSHFPFYFDPFCNLTNGGNWVSADWKLIK